MEYYKLVQTQQLAPLIAVCARSEAAAGPLKPHFEQYNIGGRIWDNCILKNRLLSAKYIIEYVQEAKVYETVAAIKNGEVALSPFHRDSPLYPNGILSAAWFSKYVKKLPFCVIELIHLDSVPIEELGAELNGKREKYSALGIRYIVIVTYTNRELGDQLPPLRQALGLPKLTGLFSLQLESASRDASALVNTILTGLKNVAVEFYTALEHRIQLRGRKYYSFPEPSDKTRVSMTPKFLEVRNTLKLAVVSQFVHPHNVELSLSRLEYAYEGVIALIRDLHAVFFSPQVTEHDAILYNSFRSLLDVVAIHLVRGYLSIEEPAAALRKHSAHLVNVLDILAEELETERKTWELIQYQWLAELITTVPISVLLDLYATKKRHPDVIRYFGGITYNQDYFSRIITHPALMYLHAANCLVFGERNLPLFYLDVFPNQKSLDDKRLQLLKEAKRFSTHGEALPGLDMYLDWLIAQELEKSGDLKGAISHYLVLMTLGKLWPGTAQHLSNHLSTLVEHAGEEELLRALASLSLTSAEVKIPLKNTELQVDTNFVAVNVAIYNKLLAAETHAYDTVVAQVTLTNEVTSGYESEVTVDSIEIRYSNGQKREIKHGDEPYSEAVEITSQESANLKVDKRTVCLFNEQVTTIGAFFIESCTISSTLQLRDGDQWTVFKNTQTQSYSEPSGQIHSLKVYDGGERMVRLHGRDSRRVNVQPYKPDVSVHVSLPMSSIIVGERLQLPFEVIRGKVQPHNAAFGSAHLVSEARIVDSSLSLLSNWEGLKDDEPLDLLDFVTSNTEKMLHQLNVTVLRPPRHRSTLKRAMLQFSLKLHIGETTGETSVYDLQTFDMLVDLAPFDCRLSVAPRVSRDPYVDMPNPFVLRNDPEEPERDFSMPLPSRTWCVSLRIVDSNNLVETGAVEVCLARIAVAARNPEVLVGMEKMSQLATEFTQWFTTRSKHRFSNRHVTVGATARIRWKREGGAENEFETEEFEVKLPLQDPRVLLRVDKGERTTLRYFVENPTPRILTFSTQLSLEAAAARGTLWDVAGQLKMAPFPVLPFSLYELVYEGSAEGGSELPHLHVFDVNFKVTLPVLPTENVVEKNGVLHFAFSNHE